MNLQEMLEKALAKVESITLEEFEQECINAGYAPVRNPSFEMMSDCFQIDMDLSNGHMTYGHSISLSNIDIEVAADTCSGSTNSELLAA